jgi:hypothetical protein
MLMFMQWLARVLVIFLSTSFCEGVLKTVVAVNKKGTDRELRPYISY